MNHRKFDEHTKYCSSCDQSKQHDQFNKGSSKSGLATYCRSCQSVYQQARNSNPKVKEKLREVWSSPKYRELTNARRRTKEGRARRLRDELLRREKDPAYAIAVRLRTALRRALTSRGALRHLSYTSDALKRHLESKFVDGMGWHNLKGWDIDHVIPLKYQTSDGVYYWDQVALSDPTSKTFQDAWSLKNLQPMWSGSNRSKGNRFIG